MFYNLRKLSLLFPISMLFLLIAILFFYKKSTQENLLVIEVKDEFVALPKVKNKLITIDKSRKPLLYDLVFFEIKNDIENDIKKKREESSIFIGSIEDINNEGCFWILIENREVVNNDWLCPKDDFSNFGVIIEIKDRD